MEISSNCREVGSEGKRQDEEGRKRKDEESGIVKQAIGSQQQGSAGKIKKKKIQPIYSDCSDDEVITYHGQQSQLESINMEYQDLQEGKVEKPIVARPKTYKKKQNCKLDGLEINPESWKYLANQQISEESLAFLKQHKKQTYQQISLHLRRIIKEQTNKRILFIHGGKETAKKTLLFEAIGESRGSTLFSQTYYLDFQATPKSHQFFKLYKYILEIASKRGDGSELAPYTFVINNFSTFFRILKKQDYYHQFKCLVRNRNLVFIFVDRTLQVIKKQSWVSQNIKTVEVPPNTQSLIVASLIAYVNRSVLGQVQWTLSKPLTTFFFTKLAQKQILNFSLLSKMGVFLKKSALQKRQFSPELDLVPKQQKVTRQLLETFKSQNFSITHQIKVEDISIHQKLVLVAGFTILRTHEQLAISMSFLYKEYCWVCESLSFKPRNQKQFKRDILSSLETYQLVQLLKGNTKSNAPQVLINMDIQQIRLNLIKEPLLVKFFVQE